LLSLIDVATALSPASSVGASRIGNTSTQGIVFSPIAGNGELDILTAVYSTVRLDLTSNKPF